jgi:hypothetical protein
MLKNSLLEKTNPIPWNRRLVLACSDIFILESILKACFLPNEPNCGLSLIWHGLQAYFYIRWYLEKHSLFPKQTQFD